MERVSLPARRPLLCTAVALVAAALAGPALSHSPAPAAPLAHVDVYDRVTGRSLVVHEKDGRQFIVGAPGHEYAIRIRNAGPRRILVVTSVDGVNVVTGETAAPEQSGYVIEPWGSVDVAGWRKNLSETAAFFFTEHSNSYAARTGRPFDVGVIGVAVFAERPRIAQRIAEPLRSQKAETAASADAGTAMPAAPTPSGAAAESRRDESRAGEAGSRPLAKLGTGHGRYETSHARHVTFERATTSPAQIVALHYDRYENLVAMGVLPGRSQLADRTPRPFPGMRFVPDPQ